MNPTNQRPKTANPLLPPSADAAAPHTQAAGAAEAVIAPGASESVASQADAGGETAAAGHDGHEHAGHELETVQPDPQSVLSNRMSPPGRTMVQSRPLSRSAASASDKAIS